MKIRPASIGMVVRVSVVAATCPLASVLASAQSTATIVFGTPYQTIHGFGTSTAWQPQLSTSEMDGLFGTGSGQVGLTILRSRIDPSSTTGGSNWATELANGQEAQAANSQVIVIATPWTPPAAWKSNDSTVQGTLNTSDYANYAAYLNAFVAYEKAGGVNLYAISMQNEPDANATYESCVWTGATMDAWVAAEGGTITTKLIMPESENFNTAYSDPALDDSNAVGHISIVAGHLYGPSPFYYTNAKNKGKDVWMTEHYLTPANGASEPAIGDAISLAEELHQSMATAQYNAYLYWWTPLLVNSSNEPNYYAFALGQFSKFVRPGYVMNGATNNPTSGVYVTAYSGSGNYVIVAINSNSGSSSIDFSMSGATVTSMTPYQTNSSGGLIQEGTVGVSSDSFTYTLPGQSITTFVGTGSGGNLIANGTYIVTAVNSGLALDNPDSSKTDGEDMDIWTVNDGTNQQWTVNNLGSNVITLTNVASGQLLDVAGASKSNSALVDQWPGNGQTNQEWRVTSLGSGNYELTSVNSGLALDVIGGKSSNGTGVDQYTYNGNTWQQWKFTSY